MVGQGQPPHTSLTAASRGSSNRRLTLNAQWPSHVLTLARRYTKRKVVFRGLTVARNLKTFKTSPEHGSFRAWLLTATRWRIINQFKKRRPEEWARIERSLDDTKGTSIIDRQAAPHDAQFEAVWDQEWRDHVTQIALQALKGKVQPKHYQIFYLHTIRGKSVRDVTRMLGVTASQVYLVKHRLAFAFRKEIERLRDGLC